MQLEDIRGYLRLSPDLVTAGQPSEDHIRQMPQLGFRHVVNLGLMDPRYCLPDEAGLVRSLGMQYTHIPVEFSAPDTDSLRNFFGTLDACATQRTFVHCAANYRVSCFMALYAQSRWGWSQSEVEEMVLKIWTPDATWRAFIDQQRQLLGLSPKVAAALGEAST